MKVAVMMTLYTTDDETINQYKTMLLYAIMDIKYEPNKLTIGKHRIANKPHTHIHFICETNVVDGKPKVYKKNGLASKLKRSKEMLPQKIESKYNLSINYDDGEKDTKGHLYDEEKILAYPLKEYDEYQQMVQDTLYIETAYDFNNEVDNEVYRKIGNDIWKKSNKYKEEKYRNDKQEISERLYNHLDKIVIKTSPEILSDVNIVVTYIIKHILMFYKSIGKNFNPNALKAQALNYLFNTDTIDADQIIKYMNL